MEENRNMENLEKEEIVTDLEVYNNDQEIITHDKVKDILKGDGTTNWIYTSTKNIFDEGSLGSIYWLRRWVVLHRLRKALFLLGGGFPV